MRQGRSAETTPLIKAGRRASSGMNAVGKELKAAGKDSTAARVKTSKLAATTTLVGARGAKSEKSAAPSGVKRPRRETGPEHAAFKSGNVVLAFYSLANDANIRFSEYQFPFQLASTQSQSDCVIQWRGAWSKRLG